VADTSPDFQDAVLGNDCTPSALQNSHSGTEGMPNCHQPQPLEILLFHRAQGLEVVLALGSGCKRFALQNSHFGS